MEVPKYDEMLSRILEEEKQIYPFLDALFGFLWRRTDFFVIQTEEGTMGFPPGAAEKIVTCIMRKWKSRSRSKQGDGTWSGTSNVVDFSNSVARMEEVETSTPVKEIEKGGKKQHNRSTEVTSSDIHNGADRGSYRWSQTLLEIEVQVPVTEFIKKSNQVSVTVTDRQMTVKVKDDASEDGWSSLVNGELCHRVNRDDTIWSLLPGQQIEIHCEKLQERLWDALLMEEPKLDTTKIEAVKPITDLSDEEQMKVQELMWNARRKELGLKTLDEERTEKILKEAWNLEGSPFKGTEFDPEIVKVENSLSNL